VILVLCDDDRPRHEPFDSMPEARQWAQWGHACLYNHTYREVEPGFWDGFLLGLEIGDGQAQARP
jgi:hypothetical protein